LLAARQEPKDRQKELILGLIWPCNGCGLPVKARLPPPNQPTKQSHKKEPLFYVKNHQKIVEK
jgi:hypothetical protein